jgi:hypothetical protein
LPRDDGWVSACRSRDDAHVTGNALAALRRFGLAVAWAVAATAISFGAAGVVAGIDHPAGPARPELTWAMDRVVEPQLAASVTQLSSLSDDVDRLGSLGRGALAALVSRDTSQLGTFLADGSSLTERIAARAAALRTTLQDMPGFGRGEELRLAAVLRDRHDRLAAALRSTEGLEATWGVLAAAGVTSTRLADLLDAHDKAAFAATTAARKLDYAGAVKQVEVAQGQLKQASQVRDQLRNAIDTTTLDEWLRRNEVYDTALHRLYVAFRDASGKVSAEVRAAIEQERTARAQLPKDTRPVTVILAELARGGATEAVIDIETARGDLEAALESLQAAG